MTLLFIANVDTNTVSILNIEMVRTDEMDVVWTGYLCCDYGYGSMSNKPTPSKNIFEIMRFLNGVEGSSYTVRIFQKIKVKKRESRDGPP